MRATRAQRKSWLNASLLLVGIFIMAISFHAQTMAQSIPKTDEQHPASIASRINAVLVPVVVMDKDGNHVRGLTREDFESYENDKDRPIANFEEIVAQAEPIHLTSPSATKVTNQFDQPRAKGLEIIALDMINTTFLHQAEARDAVIKFLSTAASSKAATALVVLEPNGVKFVHNFTSDPKVLAAAIQKVQSRLTARDAASLDVHFTGVLDAHGAIVGETGSEDYAEAAQLFLILGGAATSGGIGARVMAAESLEPQAKMDAAREGQENLNTLGSIEQLAKYFGGVPGRKTLIWASTGFLLMNHEMAGGFGGGSTAEDWLRTVRPLQDADIAVYSVDIGGLVATIRKIKSRTSFDVCRLPTCALALEISRQYKRKPARCHRTTVSGVITMSDCFHPDQNLRTKTQKNLSNIPSRGLVRFRFQTASCRRRARFSSNRLRRVRKRRRLDVKMTRRRGNKVC
jgi:VWFA-related protein